MNILKYVFIMANICILILLFSPTYIFAEEDICRNYLEVADKVVPSNIENKANDLVKVPNGPDFMAQFPDLCPIKDQEKGSLNMGYCKVRELSLRYNKNKGEMKFINRQQMFNFDDFPRKAVGVQEGIQVIIPFLSLFGNFLAEANLQSIQSLVLMGAGVEAQGEQQLKEELKPIRFEAERQFRIQRAIKNVPVEGSQFFAAVSNKGELAKFRVRWPQFIIPSILKEKSIPISREQVVAQVYKELVSRSPDCAKLGQFAAYIAYVPTVEDMSEDKDQAIPEAYHTIVYEPKLMVSILPDSQTESGDLFDVEILETGGDET